MAEKATAKNIIQPKYQTRNVNQMQQCDAQTEATENIKANDVWCS